jgi:ComF family protein
MRASLASRLAQVSAALFGGSCFLCRGAARGALCAECDAELPRLAPSDEMRGEGRLCPRCALPSPAGAVCGRCLSEAPHYDATVAALEYRFPADALVHALKFRGELALSSLLGALLAARASGEGIDLVVPVPLSAARLRARGYNPAVEIARHVAPDRIDLAACVRVGDTAPQTGLDLESRRHNVRGAFRCTRALEGARVAVVDDVMTTGATLDEIARVLKQAGAARVVNWVVARTLED